jgi:hypothetical protein
MSYIHMNALKHHTAHGHCNCNILPSEDMEVPQILLAENGVDHSKVQNIEDEVERETERRLRPFACSVGNCRRRYRSMDDLRMSLPPVFIWTDLMDLQDITISIRVTIAQLDYNYLRQGSTSIPSRPGRLVSRLLCTALRGFRHPRRRASSPGHNHGTTPRDFASPGTLRVT